MRVIKRNGDYEDVLFDKVLNRIKVLSDNLNVDYYDIAQKVCSRIYDGVKTSELDELAANICSSMIVDNPDYGTLAARIIISNHQKNTSPSFSETIYILYNNKDVHGLPNPLISDLLYQVVMKNKEKINSYIDYQRDFTFDYFGFKTLERAYLMKINGKIIERPQHLFMRVALGIHGNDIKDALQTYDLMSKKYFTHATPTLFNAGTPKPQLSSCFLLSINDDSIEGIFTSVQECAQISKHSGGIGIHVHNVRSKGSLIRGTNGNSDGIAPMLKVFNHTARYVNQCFTPETIVYTKNGIKRMDEVTCEDYLLTKDSTYRKVNTISINKVDKNILKIRGKYSFENINVTDEHEIFVIQGQQKMTNYSVIKKRLKLDIIKPKFILAKDLTKNDMVGYPIPSYEKDIIEYDNNYCRFYGIMIGDGHITISKKNCIEYGVTLNIDSKKNTVNFVKNYLEEKNIHYWISENEDKGSYAIKWSNKSINIPNENLYDKNREKYIHDSFIHLPKDKILHLLKGLLETDGDCTHEIQFYNTSYQVSMTVRYLLLRLGILSSGSIKNKIEGGKKDYIEHKKICYNLRIPKDKELLPIFGTDFKYSPHVGYFKYENIIWSRIRDIKQEHYTGNVYDFNMMDNHNYTVSSLGLVHNSGKRNGSIAVYLEPWHADVFEFLELKKPHGNEEDRARDLFYALWIPDLFMERIKNNEKWSLMCPDQCPGLSDCHSEKFNELYKKYESEERFIKQIDAQQLWFKILESQVETGGPYILFKDAANKKSNQQNLGTIKSSNLCTEIIEFSSPDETAVCNLASICVPTFIEYDTESQKPYFNFEKLHEISMIVTKNLNKVIDVNFYPVEKARRSNLRHRPIGIGIQGLADAFILMRYPFDSPEAKELNRLIFETIYHGSVEQSMLIAKKRSNIIESQTLNEEYMLNLNEFDPLVSSVYPGAYSSFNGSPAQQGKLQFDLWGVTTTPGRYDWDTLKYDIKLYGMRNSLLIAPMPTASTSQIMGFTECFEAITSNIYKRKTLAGEFILVNNYLVKDLIKLNMWNTDVKNKIIIDDGSIQDIPDIPEDIKALYKTVWELKQKNIIDMSADRGAFICQSQSLNVFMAEPDFQKLSSMHFYSWSIGLKTASYYLRTKPKAKQQKFTVDPNLLKLTNLKESPKKKNFVCTDDVCTSCSG